MSFFHSLFHIDFPFVDSYERVGFSPGENPHLRAARFLNALPEAPRQAMH